MRRLFCMVFVFALLLPWHSAAAAQPQLRAFWVDAFHPGIKSSAETDQLIHDAQRAGANTLIVQVRRRGDSYYRDSLEPIANDVQAGYDPLADLIGKAHSQGLRVHGWVASLPVWMDGYNQPDPNHVWYKHGYNAPGSDNWFTQTDAGARGDCDGPGHCGYFLDPGHPDAADYTVNTVVHLVKQYDLDGLHLDYIRYPTEHFGYNPTSVAHFQADTGRSDMPAYTDDQWTQWRRDQVTKLVKRIYLSMLAEKPAMQLSVAAITWGDGPTGGDFHTSAAYRRTLQDWDSWLSDHYIDWALPMNYEAEARSDQRVWYRDWVDWIHQHHGDGRVGIGIGAWLNTADGNMAQISYANAAGGLMGTALYSYSIPASTDRNAFLDQLHNQMWNSGAAPPVPPTKDHPQIGYILGQIIVNGRPHANTQIRLSSAGAADIFTTSDGSGVFGAVDLRPGTWTVSSDGMTDQRIGVAAGSVTHVVLSPSSATGLVAAAPNPAFGALWSRTDRPVAQGDTKRSWLWGPQAYATGSEAYAEAPGGQRTVQYWDKSRMEVTQPGADPNATWFVTNGLLVRELVSGQIQVGDHQTIQHTPSNQPIGGNANDTTLGPSYDDFTGIASLNKDHVSDRATGYPVIATIDAQGHTGSDKALEHYGIKQQLYSETLGHNIPNVFSDYLGQLPLDWIFVMGYPISEPFWTHYRVGDQVQDVMIQLFERRTLTYTPANPDGFLVEMGNVGQHYYRWRYNDAPWER
ncbi:MAG: family 10 glycosylhydrolase [Herpetosiphonaceae bacterium]|nr:family 10 glycosylhydrolase [Herpetosiphonaceae bacterium]